MNCIELKNISLSYRKRQVLSNLNLSVPTGTVFALIGPNGAGKTSLLRIVSGLLKPSLGEAFLLGDKVTKSYGNNKAVFIVEPSQLDNTLTAYQNLKVKCCILGIPDSKIYECLDLVGLKKDNLLVRNYSLGMKQRLEIALALIGNPDLLVLDEGFNGLDIDGIDMVKNIIFGLKGIGKTVLIADHNFSLLEKLADFYAILYNGQIINVVPSSEIGSRFDSLESAYKECVKGYEENI